MIFEESNFSSNSCNYITIKGNFLLLKILKHLFLDIGGFYSVPSHRKTLGAWSTLEVASKFRFKLYVCATKHSVNTYDEYLTRTDNYVSI